MPKANAATANATETKATAATAPKADKQADKLALATRIQAERANATAILAKLCDAVSNPVKSVAAYGKTYNANVQPHAIGRGPSPRQAAALYIALAASGKALADGATMPRKFSIGGVSYCIENGVLSSALSAKLATYDSASETIKISNANEIRSQLGKAIAGFKL